MPDDPWFEKIDDWQWVWMYNSWIQDQEDEHAKLKNYAIFLGAFSNYEMAKNIKQTEESTIKSSDEDFEKSTNVINKYDEFASKIENSKHRRKRKILR